MTLDPAALIRGIERYANAQYGEDAVREADPGRDEEEDVPCIYISGISLYTE